VTSTIRNAEAIFIAGGDQADYVNFWANSSMESAIYFAMAHHVPIGGTSAGLAILGDYDFAALNGTITSDKAIANPMDKKITLDGSLISERDFESAQGVTSPLVYLNNTLTDPHFMQRDRMGRLDVFLGRLDADGILPDASEYGIGINEQTALLIEANGLGTVVGNAIDPSLPLSDQQRSVYFLDATTTAPNPLTKTSINSLAFNIQRATYDPSHSDTYDFVSRSSSDADHYATYFENGALKSTQLGGAIY
jgi:cyanophycinase-like exopeptidase